MNLSIDDMRAVLQARTTGMVGKKASDDPDAIIAGVKDIRTILTEMETYAQAVKDSKDGQEEN